MMKLPKIILRILVISLIMGFTILLASVIDIYLIAIGVELTNTHTIVMEIMVGIVIALIIFQRTDKDTAKITKLINSMAQIEKMQTISLTKRDKITENRKNFYFTLMRRKFRSLQNMIDQIDKVPHEVVNDIFGHVLKYPDIDKLVYTYRTVDYYFPTKTFLIKLENDLAALHFDIEPQVLYKINLALWAFQRFYGGHSFILARTTEIEIQIKKDVLAAIIDISKNITENSDISYATGETSHNVTTKVHESLKRTFE